MSAEALAEAAPVTQAQPLALPRARRTGTRRSPRRGRYLVAPGIVTVAVLGVYPLAFIVLSALTESSLGRPFQSFVGTAQLESVLSDSDVVASLVRVSLYSIAVGAASTLLGIIGAVALHHSARSGAIIRAVLLLPLITPPVVVGVLWKLIFNPTGGLFSTVLGTVGIEAAPVLSHPSWALVGVAVADVWEWTPLIVLLVFARLLAIDPEIVEAAQLDGAGAWRSFVSITLPVIAGTLVAALLVRLVIAFKVFDLIVMMTSGGPGTATTVPGYLIYQAALQQFDVGRGAAITLLFAVVVTVVTIPFAVLHGKVSKA